MRAPPVPRRTPAAYAILSNPNPPALRKIPVETTPAEAVRIAEAAMTVGGDRFSEAQALLRAGKTQPAIQAFRQLRKDYPKTWIDRAAAAQAKLPQ